MAGKEDKKSLLRLKETSFVAASPLSRGYGSIEQDPALGTSSTEVSDASVVLSYDESTVASDIRTPSLDLVGLSYVVKERPGHWWNGSCFRPTHKKIVLHNLCMSFKSGELTALVGSSGSGKTSLLDVISGRSTGEATGVVTYKHDQCTRLMVQQKASYVLQADRLLATLTVREMMTFMAYLILPRHTTEQQLAQKVRNVLLDMGLINAADTRIGGAVTRGVSGGEKRRITIGIQLLRDPEILLLDEPTSGLDAFTARNLVSSMADLAHRGKLVIMSIHQPRSDIVMLLDKVAMMTMGQVAFFGSPKEMVPFFTKIGHPCPKNENPVDIYVDRRSPSSERTTLHRAKKICKAFSNSDLQAGMMKYISTGLTYYFNENLEPKPQQGASWFKVFHTLLVRMNTHLYRDRSALISRILFLGLFVPFIVIFLGHFKDNQGSIQDRMGVIFQATQTTPFMGLTHAVALFPILRDLMYREIHEGLYSTGTYLLAYYVHSLPFNIASVFLFSPLLYWIAGFNGEFYLFGLFTFVSIVLVQFGEMTGVAMMALFQSSQMAYNTASLLFSASGLLSTGIVRSINNMPLILQWIGFVPIHKYTTEIIVADEFHDKSFECSDSNGTQCIKDGDLFLDVYYPGVMDHYPRNFGLLGVYSVGVVLFSWFMFKVRGIPTLH